MNKRLALQIIGLIFSNKKNSYPFNVREVWEQVFPDKEFPKNKIESLGMIVFEPDFDSARDLLFNAAINYITDRLN